jgi:prepilin-type N-terminal cleavage/methylation domain-containing protein
VPLSARRHAGYSLTELLVALMVAVILMAVSLPLFLRAYHSYQLTNAARQLADILRRTRYEAIRLNKTVNLAISSSAPAAPAGMTAVWADLNGDGQWQPTEAGILLGNAGTLVAPGGVPNTATVLSQSNIGSAATQSWPTAPAIQFDARGAVVPPTNVNLFYMASAAAPDAGYRAVLLMPAGSIEIWIGDASGNWQEQR